MIRKREIAMSNTRLLDSALLLYKPQAHLLKYMHEKTIFMGE